MPTKPLVFLHQPKTGGTWVSKCLPQNRVLPHNQNYHSLPYKNKIQPACIIRDPLDYLISLVTFWCLDKTYCGKELSKPADVQKDEYNALFNTDSPCSHPKQIISAGFSCKNVPEIIENMVNDEFIAKHAKVLSPNHHTYDYRVFHEMSRLDIGYYTFAFLDQYARRKITDLHNSTDILNELTFIRSHYEVINTRNLTRDLPLLCEKYGLPFRSHPKMKVTTRSAPDAYKFDRPLLERIAYKERHMLTMFGSLISPISIKQL